MRCQACPQDATHGIKYDGPGRGWIIYKDGRVPQIFCQWHATAQAVCRNAGRRRERRRGKVCVNENA
jgi:hypothetical protein